MKILVTGAGGYLGTVLVPLLLEKNHQVVGLDRYFFGAELLGEKVLKNQRFTLVKEDIRSVETHHFDGVDAVIDLAGLSNDPTSALKPELTRQINHFGANRVANYARQSGVRRYIYGSSCSVYGSTTQDWVDETSEPNPVSVYAESKLNAERALLSQADDDFDITILRFSTIFGLSPRMRFDLVINLMTLNIWQNGEITVFGGGKQWRPLVHVRDVSETLQFFVEAEKKKYHRQIINVGNNEHNFQIQQLAFIARSIFPNTKVTFIKDDPDQRSYRVNFDKLQKTIGIELKRDAKFGFDEIRKSLDAGQIDLSDPRLYTLEYYKFLLGVEECYKRVAINGKVL